MYKDFYASLKPLEGEIPYAEEERLAASGAPLLSWYRKNRRLLPWRENPEPYSVWISEIMLQQTRVEAVKPYFARFMEALPDITSLAQVDEERLLKLWEGLGYYSRARNLKKAAVCLMEDYGGQMPASRDEILKLPGIGSYTAGAVASIAYDLPAPALDGNVVRVLTRLFADPQDSTKPALRKKYERRLEAELVRRTEERDSYLLAGDDAGEVSTASRSEELFHPGEYNQAWIELGALVCIPGGRPLCEKCPLESLCLAHRRGEEEQYPVKPPKKPRRIEKKTVCLIEWEDTVAIRKRSSKGLLASLYEYVNLDGKKSAAEAAKELGIAEADIRETEDLPDAVHIFSHVEWHMCGRRIRLKRASGYQDKAVLMVCRAQLQDRYPIPNAFRVYTNILI